MLACSGSHVVSIFFYPYHTFLAALKAIRFALHMAPLPAKAWASPGDWALMRSHITRLYVEEGRKLEEVMAIMATEYGHRGTLKMYKARIAKWGLRKYKKEDDMLFILHRTQERGIMGKKTSFIVRGREMSLEEVLRYFSKRGGVPPSQAADFERPSTPAHITYSTPSPESPDAQTPATSISGRQVPGQRDYPTGHPGGFAAQSLPEGYSLSYMKAEDLPSLIFSSSPGIDSPPSPPQTLLISEELLFRIKQYFDGSFQSGIWVSDGEDDCINTNVGEAKVEEVADFMECCQSASRLINTQNYAEARVMLSNGCKHVKSILETEDPRALDIILEALLYLKKQHNLHQVVDILRRYIGSMATIVFSNRPEHPWRKIWRLLSSVETDQVN
jgi:hypothetical protein